MKALNITIFIIILQLSVGFINELGVFEKDYMATPDNDYMAYNVTTLNEANAFSNESLVDKALGLVDFAIEAIFGLLKIMFGIIVIYPTLVSIFNIPSALSALLQGIIYVVYILGYYELKSGKQVEY